MSNLDDLLRSFVTTIVRYHNNVFQRSTQVIVADEDVTVRSLLREADLISALRPYIDRVTGSSSTRAPLLLYLLYGIKTLKAFLDKREPSSEEDLESVRSTMIDIVDNLRCLRLLYKGSQIIVNSDGQTLVLDGFLTNMLVYTTTCRSGTIVSEVVLQPFAITVVSSKENVTQIIGTQIDNHHLRLKDEKKSSYTTDTETDAPAEVSASEASEKITPTNVISVHASASEDKVAATSMAPLEAATPTSSSDDAGNTEHELPGYIIDVARLRRPPETKKGGILSALLGVFKKNKDPASSSTAPNLEPGEELGEFSI